MAKLNHFGKLSFINIFFLRLSKLMQPNNKNVIAMTRRKFMNN